MARLDAATREAARRGVASARAALQEARRAAAAPPSDATLAGPPA
jgi:hypothetical protein